MTLGRRPLWKDDAKGAHKDGPYAHAAGRWTSAANRGGSCFGAKLAEVEARLASETELARFACVPSNLVGLTPREAQRGIERFAEGPTGPQKEEAILNLLAALDPRARATCLRLIEGGADRYTVEHLVRRDIDDPKRKARAEALIAKARPYMTPAPRIVVSDIDDTVKPFKDPDVGGPVFPGARALFRALDLGPDTRHHDTAGDVHFVTARDGLFIRAERALAGTGIEYGSVAYGKTLASLLSVFGASERQIEEKVKDISTLMARNPGAPAVLFGDSSRSDPEVFRRLLASRGDRIELCLVHHVRGFPVPDGMADDPKVVVFDNYADAARVLFDRGLISEQQLDEVLCDCGLPPSSSASVVFGTQGQL